MPDFWRIVKLLAEIGAKNLLNKQKYGKNIEEVSGHDPVLFEELVDGLLYENHGLAVLSNHGSGVRGGGLEGSTDRNWPFAQRKGPVGVIRPLPAARLFPLVDHLRWRVGSGVLAGAGGAGIFFVRWAGQRGPPFHFWQFRLPLSP